MAGGGLIFQSPVWQEVLDRARGTAGLRPEQLLRSYMALCGRRCLAVLGQDAFDGSRGLGPPDAAVYSEAVIMCAPPHKGPFPPVPGERGRSRPPADPEECWSRMAPGGVFCLPALSD